MPESEVSSSPPETLVEELQGAKETGLNATLCSRWPLTQTFKELVESSQFPTVFHAAHYLFYHPYEVPVVDVKGQPRRKLKWIPSCRLGDGRRGPCDTAPIMIVGKRPGRDEIDGGRTFCGPSGTLLRNTAHEIGFHELDEAYATNILRFLPPDGGKTLRPHHIKDCAFMLAQEIELVKPQYMLLLGSDAIKTVHGKNATLEKTRSHIYVLNSLMDIGTGNIRDAGSCSPEEYVSGIKVLGTIHPAAIFSEQGYRPGFEADLAIFRDLVQGGRVSNPVVGQGCDYRIVTSSGQLKGIVDEILGQDLKLIDLAIDCEWGGGDFVHGKLRTVQFSWGAKQAACVVLRREGLVEAMPPSELWKVMVELKRLFTNPRVCLIGHNMRSDAKWLVMEDIPVMDRFTWDTMLADHMINENSEHGLDACAIRYTDMGRYDMTLNQWLKRNKINSKIIKDQGFAMVPGDVLHPYGCCDVDATWRIKQVQAKILAKPENARINHCFRNLVLPCNYPIHEIEMNGIPVDYGRMTELVWEYDRKKDELIKEVRRSLNNPQFNFRSYPQISKLLFAPKAEGGFELTPLKTTGKPSVMWEDLDRLSESDRKRYNPSTDAETLEYLGDKNPIAGMLRDLKIIDQVTKGFLRLPEEDDDGDLVYVDGLVGAIDPDDRIRTTISQMSETGRWKSSNPNLQNLPKKQDKELERIMGAHIPKIRSCFIARPGYVLIEADYKSAEIFTLGYLSNCAKLIKDARSDLHARGAVTRMGAKPWAGFEEGKSPPEDWLKEYKALRVASKTVSFGIPYQRGAKAIAREIVKSTKGKVRCDTGIAQGYINDWYGDYVEVEAYVDMCKESVKNPGHLFNPFGRTRRFFSGADEATIAAQQREAVNMPIQGTVADVLNTAVLNLIEWRRMNPGEAKYDILLAIHDAVLLEVPGEYVNVLVDRVLPECMSYGVQVPSWTPVPHWTPTKPFSLDIDIEVMTRWGEKPKPDDLRARRVPDSYIDKHFKKAA